MTYVRRLNKLGLALYRNFFIKKLEDQATPVPYGILENPQYSELIPHAKKIEVKNFTNRFEFGEYLNEVLSGFNYWDIYDDYGLWNWIALKYFEKIYPSPKKAKETIRYVLSEDDRSFWYRNMVRCPWDLVSRHGKAARVVLTKPLNVHADEAEQILAQEYIRSNTSMLTVAEMLYYQPGENGKMGTFKSGYTPTDKRAPSSVRRLSVIVKQFACTWDLHSMNPAGIMQLLPEDFRLLTQK